MAIIRCSNCGRNISDTEKVCPYCDQKIEKRTTCPKCGSEKLDFSLQGKNTSVFKCNQCGYEFILDKNGEMSDFVTSKEDKINLFTAWLRIFTKMFDFRGRARRKEYWFAVLANLLTMPMIITLFVVFFGIISAVVGTSIMVPCYLCSYTYFLVVAIGMLAMEIRRLHDTGRSWTSIFVTYIPFVGQYIWIAYMVENSEYGHNDYGPNPKGMG